VHIEGGDVMLWDDHIFILIKEVIIKTISQQEQIGGPIYKEFFRIKSLKNLIWLNLKLKPEMHFTP
jgi:hypothetical protein